MLDCIAVEDGFAEKLCWLDQFCMPDYLARSGARQVTAVEFDDRAVQFSRAHFPLRNLVYHHGDISRVGENLPESGFDVIFSSNVVEHVDDVGGFLRGSVHCLRPDGVLIFAVPPIVSQARLDDDLSNPHHVNHWSPHQWCSALSRYYEEVVPYRHSYSSDKIALNFANTPDETVVTENDFLFDRVPLEKLNSLHTFTALFVARGPIKTTRVARADERIDFPLPTFGD